MRGSRAIRVAAAVAAALACSVGPWWPARAAPGGPTVPPGFEIETIARVPSARELAALPNGDLIVGTEGSSVYIVADAEATTAGHLDVFATFPDAHAAGVAFASGESVIYVGTEHGVYAAGYRAGQRSASGTRLVAHVRTGPIAPRSDGDVHSTTSVAYDDGTLYASVGSSCNACTEADATRASILTVPPAGGGPAKRATRIRNAIALAVDPETHALWAGDAGQDNLPWGHPYEFFDNVTAHPGVADYGWPECEEDHHAYAPGANCADTIAPLIVLPAYATPIGATFYPTARAGPHAFPPRYHGALFATLHGSWHQAGGAYAVAPQVVVIMMNGDRPQAPVDWGNPNAQWQTFIGGFQPSGMIRIGRPTGIAVGAQGSLFVADDMTGAIYRIRPR